MLVLDEEQESGLTTLVALAREKHSNQEPSRDVAHLIAFYESLQWLYLERLRLYLPMYRGQTNDAETHENDARCVAFSRIESAFDRGLNPQEWWREFIMTRVSYACSDTARKQAVRTVTLAEADADVQATDQDRSQQELIDAIYAMAIRHLPPRTRQVFLMSYRENLSGVEISKSLGVSTAAVSQHLIKATSVLTELSDNIRDQDEP